MADPNDFVQARIDDYLHGLLSPAETNYVERHLEGCPACQAALEEARRPLRLLESVPAREASEPLIQATLARVAQQEREEQRWRRVRRRLWGGALAATATAALVLLGFQVHFANLQASPVDLEVFGQSELLAGSEGSLRVRLVNFPSQTPLAGVPVDIELRNAGQAVPLAQFKTNAQGSGQPRFRLPDWADGRYELCVTARPSGAPEVITRTVHLKRSWKLMLSSDKPVYQPGQTVHLRGLALHRPDLKPVAGHEAVFTLADPKGTILFKQKGVTSRFGISAADCPLATEILEGPYAIACKVGDTESKLTVDVKKYVLPKFQVALTLDRPYYAPGQTVTGTVRAGYFFGKPVADAVVEVKVETTGAGRQPLGQRERRTNAQGEATFEFALPAKFVGREQDSGDARVSFQAVVRDPAGQTQTKTESRVVTAQPLKIEIIPEAGSLVQGLANRVYLFTTHADGRPAPSRLKVSGVDRELRTNSLGVASFELTPQGTEIDLTVEAGDDSGFSSRKQAHLVCGESNQAFLVRTDKAVYTSGETMRLVVLGGDQQPVFVDLLKDGQTVLTTTLELKEGRGEYALDLPAELFGTLELVAYRFGPEGLPVRKSRALYVKPVRQLNLRATLNQAEYRPGQRAKLQFVLTDSRGKPAPGAVSLATVDEAVFSVLNQAPGMEQTFYTLDQELLKPVYAVYPWSPLSPPEGRPEERQLFEQALFARTTDQGGKIDRDTFLRGLLPYLENDPRIFRVLERPDWERLIDPSFIPKEARAILRNEVALHTLNATTYLDKVSKTEALKRSGLQAVNEFWIVFAVVIGVMLFAYFCTIALREGVVGCLIIAGISISLFF